MNTLTIAWISLPFLIGFIIYLLPRLDKYLALCHHYYLSRLFSPSI